jgi:hypothetical protein
MNLRSIFNLWRLSVKPTFEEKEKEFDEVLEEHKVDFEKDNADDLRDPNS